MNKKNLEKRLEQIEQQKKEALAAIKKDTEKKMAQIAENEKRAIRELQKSHQARLNEMDQNMKRFQQQLQKEAAKPDHQFQAALAKQHEKTLEFQRLFEQTKRKFGF